MVCVTMLEKINVGKNIEEKQLRLLVSKLGQPLWKIKWRFFLKSQNIPLCIYYAASRNDEVMQFVATWMELEDIILSEVIWKDKCLLISLICGMWNKWTRECKVSKRAF